MDKKVPVCGLRGGTHSQTEESLEGILGAMDSDVNQYGKKNKKGAVVILYQNQTPEAAVLV